MRQYSSGTQEAKRWHRAVPAVSSEVANVGCTGIAAATAALCLFAYRRTGLAVWLVLAAPAALLTAFWLLRMLYGALLLVVARATLVPRGIRCIVIYSDSPNWQSYISSNWLSRLGPVAAILNWSDRARWPGSIEVRLFRYFVGERENFNPAVLVFRGVRRPLVFRFFQAFREVKAGRPQYLSELEERMFRALGA
jgi:hypothetical protein